MSPEQKTQFTLASLSVCMAITLVVWFGSAILTGRYVVGFSIDAIVGSIGLVILVRNGLLKYRLCPTVMVMGLDAFALILSLAAKYLFFPFDFTLLIFVLMFWIERKWL